MDGLEVVRRARVNLDELVLDPAAPFRVKAAPGLSTTRQAAVRAALLGAGWGALDDDGRLSLARALLARLDDAAWDALTTATVDARAASGLTWRDAPWRAWAALIEDEALRRKGLAVGEVPDFDARVSQRERLLAFLVRRGTAGVLNSELNAAVGFRYSARIGELRDEGYVIETVQIAAQVFRFVLRSVPGMAQLAMGEVA